MTRPDLKDALISVVLPVFNEAHVLEQLHRRVHRTLADAGTGQEIIFINDGSTDETAEKLDELANKHRHVRVIHLARNFGHQAAIQAGLAHAHGDAVVLMDSDLQDSPEAIGRLVAEWSAGFDVVYAVRCERPEALWKRCLFATFHRLLAQVASTNIPADAGNFSIIDGRVVREILALDERDRYLPGLRSWVGFKQRGIEIRRERRYDDKPRVPLAGLWRLAKTAIFSFSSFPLTMFYTIGYGALALFLALGGYALFCKTMTDLAVPGWTSSVLVASFFGAVNALGICILGEYVIRIYDQVRQRPLYIIDETRNLQPAAEAELPADLAPGWPGERRVGDRRVTARPHADFGLDDYRSLDDEFDAQFGLSDEDQEYADLMAEAEELLAMARPFVRGPQLLEEGGDGLLDDDDSAEDEDESYKSSTRQMRPEGASPIELRPFHDTWSLDDEWPIDALGPIDEQRPDTRWSSNRPLPGAGETKPKTNPSPASGEPAPADHDDLPSDNPAAAPGKSSARRDHREPGER